MRGGRRSCHLVASAAGARAGASDPETPTCVRRAKFRCWLVAAALRFRVMEIRVEEPTDAAGVRHVHVEAFTGDHGADVAELVTGLRERLYVKGGLSLVAVDSDRIVGHVMFSHSLLDAPPRLVQVQVLSPVGVLPQRQGEGIGSALIKSGLEALADRGVPLVFLEGSPGYYSRLGFERGDGLGFRKPSLRIPDFAFQAKRLPAYKPWMTGTLVYSEVFWEHDSVGLRDQA